MLVPAFKPVLAPKSRSIGLDDTVGDVEDVVAETPPIVDCKMDEVTTEAEDE